MKQKTNAPTLYAPANSINRVDTASQNILNDFFESPEFKSLKKKNEERQKNFRDSRIALNNWNSGVDNSFSKPDISPISILKQNSIGKESFEIASPTPHTPGLGISGSVHLSPIYMDGNHVITDIIHRITLQSGLEPGLRRIAKTPMNESDVAEHIGELQYKSLVESESVKNLISQIVEVHKDLSNFKYVISGHRKEMIQKLEETTKLSMKLFERMLSEVLMIHRIKFKSQTSTINELKGKVATQETIIENFKERVDVLNRKTKRLEFELDEQLQLIKLKDLEIQMYTDKYISLEEGRQSYLKAIEDGQIEARQRAERNAESEAKLLMKEKQLISKYIHELEMQALRESVVLQSTIQKQNAIQNPLKKSEAKMVTTSSVEVQTEFDDFGIWDKKDGWILPISGTAIARNRWRRSLRFAACPSCKGINKFVGQVAMQLKRLQRGEIDAEEDVKRAANQGKWSLPDDIVRFMSNLPRTVLALKEKPYEWVLRKVWQLFTEKYRADAEDDALGYNVQPLSDFIIEYFLQRSDNRQEAELQVYSLFSSMRHYVVKRNPLLVIFARFLGIFDNEFIVEKVISNQKRKPSFSKSTTINLPLSLLSVYLFARSCMLHEYHGEYEDVVKAAKAVALKLVSYEKRLQGDDTNMLLIPKHVIINEQFHAFIPLDRAVQVTKAILSFLSEQKLSVVFRNIEAAALFLTPSGVFESAEGSHTSIRASFRRSAADSSSQQILQMKSQIQCEPAQLSEHRAVIVNIDKVLESIMEMLISRIKVVEEQLARTFVEGDENGDGVLSFLEFMSIVSKAAPHFHSRRILKMYREALMHGNDNNVIHKKSFVHVCKEHGLVQLIDINELKKNALANLSELDPSISKLSANDITNQPEIQPSKEEYKRKARPTFKSYVLVAARKAKEEEAETFTKQAQKQFNSFASVATASMKMQMLRRQASKPICNDSSLEIRKNLSEEVTLSSNDAAQSFVESMVTRIKKSASEEPLLKNHSNSIPNVSSETPLFPRYSQRHKLKPQLSSVDEHVAILDSVVSVDADDADQTTNHHTNKGDIENLCNDGLSQMSRRRPSQILNARVESTTLVFEDGDLNDF